MTLMHLGSRHSSAADVATERSTDWRLRSACRTEDPDLFFPEGSPTVVRIQADQAKAVCRRCPVMETCLRWNLEQGEVSGVWGGTSEEDRGVVREKRKPSDSARNREQRDNLADGRRLAIEHGGDLIAARLFGADPHKLAKRYKVRLLAIRHALRILMPPDVPLRPTATPLEKVLVRHEQELRAAVRGGTPDKKTAWDLGFQTHTISAAHRVLAHRDAALDRIGQAA